MAKKKKEKELKKIEEEVKYVDPTPPALVSKLDIFRYYEEPEMTGFTLNPLWGRLAVRVLENQDEEPEALKIIENLFRKEWHNFIEDNILKFEAVYVDINIINPLIGISSTAKSKLYSFWFRLDDRWVWSSSRLEFVDTKKDNVMLIMG